MHFPNKGLPSLLDVLHEYDCGGIRRATCIRIALQRLATDPREKYGLRCHRIECVGTRCIRACDVRNATRADFDHGLNQPNS